MGYLVWTKSEFEGWDNKEVADLEAAKALILAARQVGQDVILTQELPFTLEVKLDKAIEKETLPDQMQLRRTTIITKKEAKSEAKEDKPQPDQSA